MKPDFDLALQKHFEAITNRDINAFKSHLTQNKTLYTIVQNGHAFTTPEETIAIHIVHDQNTALDYPAFAKAM